MFFKVSIFFRSFNVFLKFQSFLFKVLTFSSASIMRSMFLTTFDNLACITFIRNFVSFHQKVVSLYLFFTQWFCFFVYVFSQCSSLYMFFPNVLLFRCFSPKVVSFYMFFIQWWCVLCTCFSHHDVVSVCVLLTQCFSLYMFFTQFSSS